MTIELRMMANVLSFSKMDLRFNGIVPLNYRWSLEISSRESERGLSHMSVYFLLIQCRSLAIVCSPEVTSSFFGGGG